MLSSGDFVIDTSSQVYAAALHPQSTLIADSGDLHGVAIGLAADVS